MNVRADELNSPQNWPENTKNRKSPDPDRADLAEECRSQSLALRLDSHEQETSDYLEAVADTEGWK